jgi:hypothetical protein
MTDIDLNPFLLQSENAAYTNSGSFIKGYKVVLPEIFTLSVEEMDKSLNIWINFIRNLPDASFIHRFDAFIEHEFNTSVLPEGTFFRDGYKNHFTGRKQLSNYAYLFVGISKLKTLTERLSNPFIRVKPEEGLTEQNFINNDFFNSVNTGISYLNKSRLFYCIPLSDDEMRYFNFRYFNLFNREYSTTLDFDAGIRFGNDRVCLTVGDNMIGGFSVYDEKQLPNELHTITADPYLLSRAEQKAATGDLFGLYLRHPHYLSTVIFKDNLETWTRNIDRKARDFGRLTFADKVFARRREELEALSEGLKSSYNDEFIVRSNTSVIFWSNDRAEYLKIKNDISAVFQKLYILPYIPQGKHLKNIFVCSNPLFSSANSDLNLYPNYAGVPVSFFTVSGNYGNDDEGMFFCDRFNVPARIDIWDRRKKHIKARNFVMLAPTGEGKSFFLQELLRQYKEAGVVLVIIDLGKSFKKFAHLMGSDAVFIEYNHGQSMGINPFNRPVSELLVSDKLDALSDFVYAHIDMEESNEGDKLFLRNLIRYYIEREEGRLSMPSFIRFIHRSDEEIKKLFSRELKYLNVGFDKMKVFLKEFIDEGIYAFMYSEDENSSLAESLRNKKVCVFEVERASSNIRILSIVLQIIKDTIYTNIWSDKSKRGVILFEEFSKMLKYNTVLTQVEFYFQAIRKQEGSIGIVLQSPNQIPVNDTSGSIFDNTQIIFALENTNGYSGIVERLKLDEEKYLTMLNSLKSDFTGACKYAEFFMKQGNRAKVFRNEVSREQYLAFITDGDESVRLNRAVESGTDIFEAINRMK